MIIHLMLCHTLSKNANPIILFGKLVVWELIKSVYDQHAVAIGMCQEKIYITTPMFNIRYLTLYSILTVLYVFDVKLCTFHEYFGIGIKCMYVLCQIKIMLCYVYLSSHLCHMTAIRSMDWSVR